MAVFKGNGNIFTHSKEHLKPLKVCVAPIRDKLNRSRILVRYDSRYSKNGFGDLDLKKGVDHDLKLEKGEVWNKI